MDTESSAKQTPAQLLEEGKKYLAAGNAAEAVECFQEACEILSELHGQVACELAEPYYLYGRALLELARTESTILGSGIPVPAEKEDSSDDENGDITSNGDAPSSSATNEVAPDATTTTDDAPETSTADAGGSGTNEDAPGSSTANKGPSGTNEDAPGSSTANEEGSSTTGGAPGSSNTIEQNEEEETDLKLAWEILELARVICQKQSNDEYKLKLADVQLALAEVSLESDQTEQAIADMNTSLQLRELLLEPHDRRLAEVHFSLGLAHTLAKQPDLAIRHYNCSKDVLNKRKEALSKELTQTDLSEERRKALQEEISDLDALLPDLESKIVDTQEMKRMIEERENETEAEGGFPASNTESVSKDKKPVTDISHLVRKRVTDDSAEGNQAKKPRTDEAVNGNGQPSSTVAPEQ